MAYAAADPGVEDTLIKVGVVALSSTPADFVKYIRTEQARWSEVFKAGGFKLD